MLLNLSCYILKAEEYCLARVLWKMSQGSWKYHSLKNSIATAKFFLTIQYPFQIQSSVFQFCFFLSSQRDTLSWCCFQESTSLSSIAFPFFSPASYAPLKTIRYKLKVIAIQKNSWPVFCSLRQWIWVSTAPFDQNPSYV